MKRAIAMLPLMLGLFGVPPPERLRPREFTYAMPQLPAGPALAAWLERYSSDQGLVMRYFNAAWSAQRRAALRSFHQGWLDALKRVDFAKLNQDGQVEAVAFRHVLEAELGQLALEESRWKEIEPLLPFARALVDLWEERQRVDPMRPDAAAATLERVRQQVEGLEKELPNFKLKPSAGLRAAQAVEALRATTRNWHGFYNGYDPRFTWWTASPWQRLDKSLERYAEQVREKVAGLKKDDRDTILGDPIGRDALLIELRSAMIPYTPEELIAMGEREMAWCEREMKKAAAEMGLGDDWRTAVERVKQMFVEPGRQPDLVRDLALEAMDYVEKHDLVTVPPLAKSLWRMQMMSAERQRISPFFLGGESIIVSYPTAEMTQEEKLMSMRGNNIHFSRSTVFHELIPGHWLQQYMTERHLPYRRALATPFWTEGWALYWEMLLWDRGFPRGPEDRIGMLYWRMHRCARIIFSLSFHLEKMTAQECVKFLVERCAQEPRNSAAEVRRSFEGSYGPLYQIAYMVGAFQFRTLNRELVGAGKMGLKEFHDRILTLGRLPVELVRATLTGQPLAPDFTARWQFYDQER